jgi:4-amino-4-deoxy-L-arabinose transferase-like glycosyltransferase
VRRTFVAWLSVITLIGLAFRVIYVALTRHMPIGLDSTWYYLEGGLLQHGQGYSDPGSFFNLSRQIPTASWTPFYPGFLTAGMFMVGTSIETARLFGLLPATFTILGTGLLARRIFDTDGVGLVAAALVALSPLVVTTSMSLMSEVLSVPLTVALMLAAQSIKAKASLVRFGAFGALAGIACLARPDLLVVAGILLLFVTVSRSTLTMVLPATLAVLVCVLVLLPWLVRNDAVMHTLSLTTTSFATAVAGSNCPLTYSGRTIGFWEFSCIHNAQRTPDNEVAWSNQIQRDGVDYAQSHAGRLPVVVGARVLRTWGFWGPGQLATESTLETQSYGWQLAGWIVELPLLLLALSTLVAWRRRLGSISVLIAPLIAVTLVSALTYGNPRFRSAAEPAIAMLAAWALCNVRWRKRERPG